LQESRAEVVIVDMPSQSAQRAIGLIYATTQIANGDMTQPANIVATIPKAALAKWDQGNGCAALIV
jgi:hypothetical protein